MAYTMSATGGKGDVIGQLRQQAAAQSAGLTSQREREHVTEALDEAEKIVNEFAGDTDSVSVTIGGNVSQSDTALGISKNVGVSISRGAAASQPAPEGAPITETVAAAPRPNPRI